MRAPPISSLRVTFPGSLPPRPTAASAVAAARRPVAAMAVPQVVCIRPPCPGSSSPAPAPSPLPAPAAPAAPAPGSVIPGTSAVPSISVQVQGGYYRPDGTAVGNPGPRPPVGRAEQAAPGIHPAAPVAAADPSTKVIAIAAAALAALALFAGSRRKNPRRRKRS